MTQDGPVSLDRYSAPQWLGAKATRRFHVMVKPAGSACNLDCTYCFYLSKQQLEGGPGGGHMHEDVLERFVRDYIESVTGDEVVFSWQGGEPTLMGLDFFRKVVALQRSATGCAWATTCSPADPAQYAFIDSNRRLSWPSCLALPTSMPT